MEIQDGTNLDRITEPGIYANLAPEVYHGNCCPGPSLSSSGARLILNECPAYFWHHSSLNPHRERTDSKAFDIGTACHLITLEPHLFDAQTAVISVPGSKGGMTTDYKSGDAQAARDLARSEGKVPLLPKERDMLVQMRDALSQNRIASQAFRNGHVELSLFWRDRPTGVWLKARPDFLDAKLRHWVDFKTTTTANPEDFGRKAYQLGYHLQDAWLTDAIEICTGVSPRNGWFVAQDKEPPHLATVARFPVEAVEMARADNRRAIDLFARCVKTNTWPGYRSPDTPDKDSAFVMSLPGWMARAHQNNEEN